MSTSPGEHKKNESATEEFRMYQERELVTYIRDTVVRLETLADRLEGYIKEEPGHDN